MASSAVRSPQHIGILGWTRIVVRVTAMAVLLCLCVPLHYLARAFHLPNPWPRVFLGGIAWLAGVEWRVHGERPEGGCFLLANHVSWLDIPLLAAATGTAFVAHDGLASVPLIRWLCAMNDTVFVARHDRASIAAQVEQVRAAINDLGSLAIFPEGTTSDGTGLLPFKSSLLSALDPLPAGVSIQPVLVDYGAETAAIAWIGTEHGLANFKRILARSHPIVASVTLLAPLRAHDVANRKVIANAARDAIAARQAVLQRVAL